MGAGVKPRLSDARVDEMLAQCSVASHGGKTLGQTVLVQVDHLKSILIELKALRIVNARQED